MQIDQDPGEYRVQRPDGSWTQRVNKPLCRWLSLMGAAFLAYLGVRFAAEGGNGDFPLVFGIGGFFVGALFTLSLKSLNW